MSERQPIGTAPKDGTKLRLFHELNAQQSEPSSTTGFFDRGRWVMNQGFLIELDGQLRFSTEPTHWLPETAHA